MGNKISSLKKGKKNKKETKLLLKEANRLFKHGLELDSKSKYCEAFSAYRQGVECIYFIIMQSEDEKFKVKLWKMSVDFVQRTLLLDLYLKTKGTSPPKEIHANNEDYQEDFEYVGFDTREEIDIVNQLIKCTKKCNNVKWDDIIGSENAKEIIREQFIYPTLYPDMIKTEKMCQGLLLYGPPGTGKTFLALCAASEIPDITFFTLSCSDLKSKWHGASEKITKIAFRMARQRNPSIMFIGNNIFDFFPKIKAYISSTVYLSNIQKTSIKRSKRLL